MIKKILLVILLVVSFSLFGCSTIRVSKAKKEITITKPTKTIVKAGTPAKIENAKKLQTSSFDKNVHMKAYGESVPVLMYHSITYQKGNDICLPPKMLDEELKYLKDNGYYTITLNDLYEYLMSNTPIPQKSVVLTFDDGYENNYSAMFPILKKYNFKATIFVITSNIDKDPRSLTSKQLLEMEKYGVDIESHTVNHDNLKITPKKQQLETLIQSKQYLEKLLNKKINYFAFPFGGYNNDAVESLKAAGYTMAFTTNGNWSSKKNGIFTLNRVYMSSSHGMGVFEDRISNPNYRTLP